MLTFLIQLLEGDLSGPNPLENSKKRQIWTRFILDGSGTMNEEEQIDYLRDISALYVHLE